MRLVPIFRLAILTIEFAIHSPAQSGSRPSFHPRIPVVWDDREMKGLELPLASGVPVRHVPSDYYYRIPVRPIYKTYPIHRPDREPPGYFASLLRQEPAIVFNAAKLQTREDWIAAGKEVFESGVDLSADVQTPFCQVRNPQWYAETQVPVLKNGVMPLFRYVIRKRGKIDVTVDSCASCHTRVMADGAIVPGAQGSMALGKMFAF